jgi:hypothetical protein
MELMNLSRLDLEGEFDERVRRAIRHMIDLEPGDAQSSRTQRALALEPTIWGAG